MNQLIKLWTNNEQILKKKNISQIMNLISEVEEEKRYNQLREFFGKITNEMLEKYIKESINSRYEQCGFVLQELVNEVGKRLGFNVEYGVHRGRRNTIGYDAIWTTKDQYSIIIESKKTDVYSIDLGNLNEYRKKLIESGRISEEKSSILIVRGKEERRVLEEQIRGSRYAWNMRIVGIEALLKLLQIKSNLNDEKTLLQIYELLKPLEYTKIDKLIDLIFFTAEDSKLDEKLEETESRNIKERSQKGLELLEQKLNIKLYKKLNNLYASENEEIGIEMCISKKYERNRREYYWFAYHPYFYDNLKEYSKRYIAYICEGLDDILLIPVEKIEELKNQLSNANKDKPTHWHIIIYYENNEFKLKLKGRDNYQDITKYKK